MKCYLLSFLAFYFLLTTQVMAQEKEFEFEKDTVKLTREQLPPKYQPDFRIDNMGYWRKMAELGLVPVAPNSIAPAPVLKTSKIIAKGFAITNSPDIAVTSSNTTQSENSIFASPTNSAALLN